MLDYSEKRSFPRMTVDCAARYQVDGSDQEGQAIVKDLSAGGVQLWTDGDLAEGSKLSIEILPGKQITPPLHAILRVERCTPLENGFGGAEYKVACSIEKILDAE
ncbi:MAG: PilZ domain-containing protein [Gammaproteobacteria bacterium]|nr:PilZ domain-containing protein [Gammaproteobacteria bacterium]